MEYAPSSPESETRGVKVSANEPACDQCRLKKIGCGRELPSCSNCSKAGVECVRSNRIKRPNQTLKLAGDVENIGNRLGGLEKNVSLVYDRLDDILRLLPQQPNSSLTEGAFKKHNGNTDKDTHRLTVQDVIVSGLGNERDSRSCHLLSDRQGTERLVGTSSLISLFEDADEKINTRLEALRPRTSLRDIITHSSQQEHAQPPPLDAFLVFKAEVYRGLSLSWHEMHCDLSNDGLVLLLPPKRLLEPIIEPYFRHISPVVPVMERTACLRAIEQYYSSAQIAESLAPAWIILFNYMILVCFVGRYMPLDRPSSDVDVVSASQFEKPFVANLRRALGLVDKLLAPKLVNVQALMALTLVSQKYFSEHETQYLLSQTCLVAKLMGLHKQSQMGGGLAKEDEGERLRVFWCLFIIDKDVSLLLGMSPNLHRYDCAVPYPTHETFDFLCRIDFATLLEKIYILLYSATAEHASPEQIERHIAELMADLDELQRKIENVPTREAELMPRSWQFLKHEHQHTIHHMRLMMVRQSRTPDAAELRTSAARQCIRAVKKLHIARATVGGFMVLRRPFQWRPFAAFFELLPSIFAFPVAQGQLDDLALLTEVVDMLRLVASADDPLSYCGKLFRIASACVRIAGEFVQQCLRQQNASSPPITVQASSRQRKRRASTEAVVQRGGRRLSKTQEAASALVQECPGGEIQWAGIPDEAAGTSMPVQAVDIQPTEITAPTRMEYGDFGDSSLMDMFPGWPGTSSDLTFLDDGFFWGGEDIFSPQQEM